MSSSGKRLAAGFALVCLLFLPKRVECGWPGAECARPAPFRQVCRMHELEPLGFYLLELVARRDVGFAYSAADKCR